MDMVDVAGYIFGIGLTVSVLLAVWVFPLVVVCIIWEWLKK